jgi:flagellar hook-associated protein 2
MSEIHMGGLLSGLDIESLVTQLSVYQQQKVTDAEADKTELENDVAAWADISGYMTSLTSSLYTLYSSSLNTWDQYTAASSDTTVVTATADTGAVSGSYAIEITDLAQAHSISSDKASDLSVSADKDTDLIAEGVLTADNTFVLEGVTFTIGKDEYGQTLSGTESLSSLKSKINYASTEDMFNNDVSATIIDDRLVITREDTGSTEIDMSEGTGTPLQDLQIFSAPATYKAANVLTNAQDASFTVNGAAVTRSSNTNLNDVIEDITLNLLDDSGASATVTVDRDTETPKNAILDFISCYNDAISTIESYNEIDIDTAAKPIVGELQGETMVRMIPSILRRLATTVNSDLTSGNASYTYQGNTGILNSLEDIGVWTGSETSSEFNYGNRLAVKDETKLDYMLENYFDEVEQMFKGISSGSNDGLAEGLYKYSNSVSQSSSGEIAEKISSLTDDIQDQTDTIADLEDELADYQEQLWTEFTAMEEAISNMQSELSWLTSQLGLTGSND